MTQPRPTAVELIEAVRSFLAEELLPELEGRKRFHTRVAVNVLETIERELRDGPGADDEEHARLTQLLADVDKDARTATDPVADVEGQRFHDHPTARRSTDELARELAARIRSGSVDIDHPGLIDHLRRTAIADVAIANPKWLD